jgi:hypothetical protein
VLLAISPVYKTLSAEHDKLKTDYILASKYANHLGQMLAYDNASDRSSEDLMQYYAAIDKRSGLCDSEALPEQRLNSFSILTELRKLIKV